LSKIRQTTDKSGRYGFVIDKHEFVGMINAAFQQIGGFVQQGFPELLANELHNIHEMNFPFVLSNVIIMLPDLMPHPPLTMMDHPLPKSGRSL
jgi:hypothetical protein